MTIFFEIATALVVASFLGILFHLLRQPTIIGFIFAGLLIGYVGGIKHEEHGDLIESLSSIGVALLLFMAGLEMSIKEIRAVGFVSIVTGLGQIIFTFGVGYFLAISLGFAPIVAFYLSSALMFSSTIIVVKLLSEKKDLKSLYGRIAIGFLLVQDLVAIMLLIFLSGFNQGDSVPFEFVMTLIKSGFFLGLAAFASKIFPKFLDRIGGAPELLYLFSISWAIGMGALFASSYVGLSVEIGGFLAGLVLANSSENFQIGARLKPLRDFFVIIFFMGLGLNMLSGGGEMAIPAALALSAFVLIGNPLIVFLIMSVLGYRARTSFLASLTSAQISEFSFIIAFLGHRIGHIGGPEVALISLVGIISIFLSSYLIVYGNRIYRFMRPILKKFEFKKRLIEEVNEETYLENHIVLAGVHRMGQSILRALADSGEDFVAVDFDPMIVKALRDGNLPAFYGDITDPEIEEMVGLDKAGLVISTIPDFKDNLAVLSYIKKNNPEGKTIVTAQSEREAEDLYSAGADYVLLPHFVGGMEIAEIISENRDLSALRALRARDFKFIKGSE